MAMNWRDAPAGQAGRIARQSSLADFMADDTANGCTADGSDRAAVGKNGTANGTDSSADGSAFILCRHIGTPNQAQQHGCSNGTEGESVHCFHG
jgi:hypothetical protein